jgi:hypothetical protein
VGTFVCGTTSRALPHLVRRDLIPAARSLAEHFLPRRPLPLSSALMRRLQSNCSRVRTRVPRTVAALRRGWERSRKSHRASPVIDDATGIDRPQATPVNPPPFSCEHVLEFVWKNSTWEVTGE